MYQKILSDPLTFPAEISPDARSLLTGLLTREPASRLGVNGAEEIKKHPFFSKTIDWDLLMAKKIQPPFKPSVESSVDTSNVRWSVFASLRLLSLALSGVRSTDLAPLLCCVAILDRLVRYRVHIGGTDGFCGRGLASLSDCTSAIPRIHLW